MPGSPTDRIPRGIGASGAVVAVAALLGLGGVAASTNLVRPDTAAIELAAAEPAPEGLATVAVVTLTPFVLFVLLWFGRRVALFGWAAASPYRVLGFARPCAIPADGRRRLIRSSRFGGRQGP